MPPRGSDGERGQATGSARGRLLEREAELAALTSAIERAREGTGRIVLIEGPAGVGKTRLGQAAAAAAEAREFDVLTARGTELERDLPFGVVRQLFEPRLAAADPAQGPGLMAGAAALAEPVLNPGALRWREGSDPGFSSLHGLYWLTANLAEEAPVLLVIDDVQWADAGSLRFLRFLAPRLEGLPVLACLALRSTEPRASSDLGSEIRENPDLVRLTPAPLSAPGVEKLVRGWFGPEADERFCAACHEVSAGNPFILIAVLRELSAPSPEPVAIDPREVVRIGPKVVESSVLPRMRRAGEGAQELAEAVAVLGDRATLDHAVALADLEPSEAEARADDLAEAGILEPEHPLRFTHPIIREAVYRSLPDWRRAGAHREAAGALAAADEPAATVASQLLETEADGEVWVVDVLREAAADAQQQGAPDEAARFLRRALAEPPKAEDHASILIELGRAEARAAEPAAIERLAEAVRIDPDAAVAEGGVVELSRSLVYSDRAAEAIRIVEPILGRLAERDPDGAYRLEAEILAAGTATPGAYELVKPRYERVRSEVREARTPPEKLVLGVAAWEWALTGGSAAGVTELARRSLADGRLLAEEDPDSPAMLHAINALTICDELSEARGHFQRVIDVARRSGAARAVAIASWWRSWASYRCGQLAEAESEAREVLEVASSEAWQLGGPMALALIIDSLVERGRVEEAALELERSGLAEPTDSILFQPFLLARARLRMLEGKQAAAFADVIECGRRLERWGVVNPSLVPWRGAAARGLAATGEHERARELADEEVGQARAFGAPRALGMALRSRALLERGQPRLDRLEKAREALEGSQAQLELARVLCDLGIATRRAGEPKRARPFLRRARELAAECEAAALERRALDELIAAGARPRRHPAATGVAALTPAERRVADRAATGKSNREIAQELFITVRTVETHLGHVYRKLDISSRVQLADVAGLG